MELEDEFAFLEEGDIVMSAAKHKQKTGFSPAAVIVITRREIEESGATTLMELLRRYPAVDVYEFDPLYPTAEIRGTYRIMLMLDGRETNLEMFVSPFYQILPVALTEIERIEIVLGPNSALYGANAVSAVINLVSRKPEKDFHADAWLAAGERNGTNFSARVTDGLGPLALQATIGHERSDSWAKRGALAKDVTRATGTARLDIGESSLTLDGGAVLVTGRIFGLMGYIESEDMLLSHARAEFEWRDITLRAYWYRMQGVLDLELGLVYPDNRDISLGEDPVFDMTGDTAQIEGQYNLQIYEDNLLIVGVDFRFTRYHCNTFLSPDIQESRFGVFAHDEQRLWEKVMLTGSLRFDWNSKTDWALSPRAAVVYNPAGEHYLRLSGGTAFRKPSLMETSMDFKIDADPAFPELKELFEVKGLSNKNLENEILATVELGYRGAMLENTLRLGADFYLGFNRNMLGFSTDVKFEQTPLGPQINIDDSDVGYTNEGDDNNNLGLHLNAEYDPVEQLTLFARADYRYMWLLHTGEQYNAYPELLMSAGGTLRLDCSLTIHLAYVYITRRDSEVRNPYSILGDSIDNDTPARHYLMGSLMQSFALGDSSISAGITFFNLFNNAFREEPGVITDKGDNYGGELLRRRIMLTARLVY